MLNALVGVFGPERTGALQLELIEKALLELTL